MYFPLSTIDELQDRKFNTKMNRYFNTKDIRVAKILHRPTLQTLLFVFL